MLEEGKQTMIVHPLLSKKKKMIVHPLRVEGGVE
jgi:hypothetical protein